MSSVSVEVESTGHTLTHLSPVFLLAGTKQTFDDSDEEEDAPPKKKAKKARHFMEVISKERKKRV